MKLFFLAIALTGCATVETQPELFQLGEGEVIVCTHYAQGTAGLDLVGCGADGAVEFNGLTNVKYIGHAADNETAPKIAEPGKP